LQGERLTRNLGTLEHHEFWNGQELNDLFDLVALDFRDDQIQRIAEMKKGRDEEIKRLAAKARTYTRMVTRIMELKPAHSPPSSQSEPQAKA
jgi:hypothetical protein